MTTAHTIGMQTCYDQAKSCQLNVRMLSPSANNQTSFSCAKTNLCCLLDYDIISLVSSYQHFKYTALCLHGRNEFGKVVFYIRKGKEKWVTEDILGQSAREREEKWR